MKKTAITIPVYKAQISEYELVSFKQGLKVFGGEHDVFLFTHKELDCSLYQQVALDLGVRINFIYFSPNLFLNIGGYNKLMTSVEFYKAFENYDYILIYQLDCFVFRNELKKWAEMGYSYYGAPWVRNPDEEHSIETIEIFGVGNGGFSLRNVQDHINALQFYSSVHPKLFSDSKHLKTWYARLRVANKDWKIFEKSDKNEDMLFGKNIQSSYIPFTTLPAEKATEFAIERPAKALMDKFGLEKPPFGLHAWWKYDLAFWKPFIEDCGYKL